MTLFEMNSPQYYEEKTDIHRKIFVLEKDSGASGRIDINDLEWKGLLVKIDKKADGFDLLLSEIAIIKFLIITTKKM